MSVGLEGKLLAFASGVWASASVGENCIMVSGISSGRRCWRACDNSRDVSGYSIGSSDCRSGASRLSVGATQASRIREVGNHHVDA